MVVVKKVKQESILPSVCEDEGENEEDFRGIAIRPASRPRSLYSRGSVNGQRYSTKEKNENDYVLDERPPFDPTGHLCYREACRMLNVIPVSHFLRNINQSELNMMHCGLGTQGNKALAVALETNTSILKLNLGDNSMEGMGGADIAGMLKENCYITEIDLSENWMGENGSRALAGILLENTVLLSLNLSGNHLDEHAARHLAPALTGNQKLQHLDLSHNKFGDMAGKILGAAIAENTAMKSLNLAWNCIRGKAAIAFAKGLGGNVFLRTLDLSYNGLGKEGAIALEEALKHNNTLEDLNIGYSKIAYLEGAIHFALGLKVNTTPRILKMSRNPMQSAGCFTILKSVQVNPESVIEFLDFTDICVDQEFEDFFNTMKDTLPNLQVEHGGKIKTAPKKVLNFIQKHVIWTIYLCHPCGQLKG
ncbi:leucine-rich repeat-containing protein 74B-like [Myxocyprinus asiaticus]|uniref:leucine-rich repeat-containing protein 74B-like n=1 Tax=Myxocyprinus asiaticus TaxID=70543 RepID=UPI0022213625|nr:leucine-rich repeat-containing protein 74B-like [Myxocyprinus asiaticus]